MHRIPIRLRLPLPIVIVLCCWLPDSVAAQSWIQFADAAAATPSCIAGDELGNIFLGDISQGLFRSTDHGKTWQRILHDPAARSILAVAHLPGGIILASTPSALFRSTNGGSSWKNVDVGGAAIRSFGRDSTNRLVAGTADGVVLRSEDYGSTWKRAVIGVRQPRILCFAFTPTGRLLAGLEYQSDGRNTGGGLGISDDNGASWREIEPFMVNTRVPSIAVHPSGYIILGVTDANAQRGCSLFSSSDDGNTWTIVPMQHTAVVSFNGIVVNGKGDVITNYHGSIYRSPDKGSSWLQASNNPKENPSLLYRASGGWMYAMSSKAIYSSTDDGLTWSVASPDLSQILPGQLSNAQISAITPDPRSTTGAVFIGTNGLGLWVSAPAGAACRKLASLKGDTVRSLLCDQQGAVTVSTEVASFRSTDGGATWAAFGPNTVPVLGFTTDKRSNIWATTINNGVYYSTNSGLTWRTPGSELHGKTVRTLRFDNYGRGICLTSEGVLISEDEGRHWFSVTNSIGNRAILAMEVLNSGAIVIGTEAGVYVMDEYLTGWTHITDALPTDTIFSLARDPFGRLYAGTRQGVWYSDNLGLAWRRGGMMLGNWAVTAVAAHPTGEKVYLGTNGNGAFWGIADTSDLGIDIVQEPTSSATMLSAAIRTAVAAPNPCTTYATFQLQINRPTHVTIELCSLTGGYLQTVLDDDLSAGQYRQHLDVTPLAAGTYLYRIHAGAEVIHGRIVKMP
ncbi:MAG: hypothetical protein IT211_00450 [Armatimonadetes bacterium]|nr:hypothetical protein [Armatimonadota bacterium]